MSKPKIPKEPIEVKHISTTSVELIRGELQERLQMQQGRPWKFERYAIKNYFLVKGEEWIIRSICSVEVPEVLTRKYDRKNHENLNQLILNQAHDLFNRLIGSRYNEIELGMKDNNQKYSIHDPFQRASGCYFSDNKLDLEYSQNAQYFDIGEGFKPYFKLSYRDWD
jgi:hypothetical protein